MSLQVGRKTDPPSGKNDLCSAHLLTTLDQFNAEEAESWHTEGLYISVNSDLLLFEED
jgi:hypothetical protein